MFKNYLTTAFRSVSKNKLTSFINITGLTLGMAAAIVLLLNSRYECSADQFHTHKNNLCFTYSKLTTNGKVQCRAVSSATLAPATQKEFSEVKAATRTADPSFLHMFSFPLLHGDINTTPDTEPPIKHSLAIAPVLDLLSRHALFSSLGNYYKITIQ